MSIKLTPIQESLKSFFGFNSFKGNQEEIIQSVLNGEDTFVIMPTGGGKSMCYQLPAIMSEGTAIIISPLIALMKNQVDAIRNFSNEDGIAHFLNSSLNKTETRKVKEDIISGKTKMLYVAPESLSKQENIDFFRGITVPFVAVDEAHCISEWGHDFRPEYRRIKEMIMAIDENTPIMALTATATPKVQQDIIKNLGMKDSDVYKASFNRPNLFYEVRVKKDAVKHIITYIKANAGKSGIIYCLSRKKVEEIAETLKVNGIKALPYHAGFDSNKRARHQDMFLMEDTDVIVATIAFGMGIDKPDVRFVMHYDIPKSLEGYYQETGRAGRDGGEGRCIAYYDYKDIEKLEKFMQGKPVAEQEVGKQLLEEVVAYAETGISRRKFLLNYFGEEFDEVTGEGAGLDDNTANPKETLDATEEITQLLKVVFSLKEQFKGKYLTKFLSGTKTTEVKTYKHDSLELFGIGSDHDEKYWMALVRQAIIGKFLNKEIESYGILKMTAKGFDFIKNPTAFHIYKDHDYETFGIDDSILGIGKGGASADPVLFGLLKDLRKKIADTKKVPPFIIFQDPSLEDMATQYPITPEEMINIIGVGQGKAMKFGTPFLTTINKYVDENDIIRPNDMVVKSVVNKSGKKVYIIQSIDRKRPLEDIASAKGFLFSDLITEIEHIVDSGTKVNLDYYINENIDEDKQEEVFDYFHEAESDSVEDALEELGPDDYTEEEVRLMRIKFLSELGN
jgi:ATP-dependent DNA helicase RecQ